MFYFKDNYTTSKNYDTIDQVCADVCRSRVPRPGSSFDIINTDTDQVVGQISVPLLSWQFVSFDPQIADAQWIPSTLDHS